MKKFERNLTILILTIDVVLIWRGVWGLLDLYLFPSNEILSLSTGIIVGIIILYSHGKNLRELL